LLFIHILPVPDYRQRVDLWKVQDLAAESLEPDGSCFGCLLLHRLVRES